MAVPPGSREPVHPQSRSPSCRKSRSQSCEPGWNQAGGLPSPSAKPAWSASTRIDAAGPAVNSVIEVNPDALAIAEELDRERLAGRGARSAARHPGHAQGQRRHRRRDADHRRIAGSGGGRGAQGLVGCFAAAGGRRPADRQDQPQRMGQLPVPPLDQRLERPGRADKEPVLSRAEPLRLQFGIRRRRVRRHRAAGHRDRDERIHRVSVVGQRDRGHQADRRPGEPRRHRSDLPHAGHSRTHGPLGRRRGSGAGATDGARRAGRGDSLQRRPRSHLDYTRFLDPEALRGARIGLLREYWGRHAEVDAILDESVAAMRDAGGRAGRHRGRCRDSRRRTSPASRSCCSSSRQASIAILADLGPDAEVRSLDEVIGSTKSTGNGKCRTSARTSWRPPRPRGRSRTRPTWTRSSGRGTVPGRQSTTRPGSTIWTRSLPRPPGRRGSPTWSMGTDPPSAVLVGGGARGIPSRHSAGRVGVRPSCRCVVLRPGLVGAEPAGSRVRS